MTDTYEIHNRHGAVEVDVPSDDIVAIALAGLSGALRFGFGTLVDGAEFTHEGSTYVVLFGQWRSNVLEPTAQEQYLKIAPKQGPPKRNSYLFKVESRSPLRLTKHNDRNVIPPDLRGEIE